MHGINSEEVVGFWIVWCIAAVSGLARVASQRSYMGWSHLLGLSASSGFLGVAIVGLCCARDANLLSTNRGLVFGIAVAVGIFGKEAHVLLRALLTATVKRLTTIDIDEQIKKDESNQDAKK